MLHKEVVSRLRAKFHWEPHPEAGAGWAVPGVLHAVAGGVELPYAEGLVFGAKPRLARSQARDRGPVFFFDGSIKAAVGGQRLLSVAD